MSYDEVTECFYCDNRSNGVCMICGAQICGRHSTEYGECYERSDARPLHIDRSNLEPEIAHELTQEQRDMWGE